MSINLSIVLPCYNESKSLEKLFSEYAAVLTDVENIELVAVDNGSSDGTAELMQELAKRDWPYTLSSVTVNPNRGYGNGILRGIEKAQGEYIAWTHADAQTPPGDVVTLYRKILAEADPTNTFGKGFRINDRGRAQIFTTLQTMCASIILGYRLQEINAQPKLFHRSFLECFGKAPLEYELDIYAYYWALKTGRKIVEVDVHFLEREHGQSKWAYSAFSKLRFIIRNFIYLLKLRIFGG